MLFLNHDRSCFAVHFETAAFPQSRHASSLIWNARCRSSQITKLQLITLIGRYAVCGLLLETHFPSAVQGNCRSSISFAFVFPRCKPWEVINIDIHKMKWGSNAAFHRCVFVLDKSDPAGTSFTAPWYLV